MADDHLMCEMALIVFGMNLPEAEDYVQEIERRH
jgi:hypothetical protein